MENKEKQSNVESTREYLAANGFKFSKSMGQNFLIDANIPEKIVKLSGIDDSCGVLEVGPGLGALTDELSKSAGFVAAVELDKRLISVLKSKFAETKNVYITQGDILKLDIRKLVDDVMPDFDYHVCANLPYNITTPVITAFVESGIFKSVTIMVQKEVALRICAKPGSKDYGAFTVYTNYHTDPEMLFDVSPTCFIPRPKVTSSVVRMRIREERLLSPEDEKYFFKVVKAAFGQRRKTLVNALHAVLGETISKDEIAKILERCDLNKDVRGETLCVEEFIKISSQLR